MIEIKDDCYYSWVPEPFMTWLPEEMINQVEQYKDQDFEIDFLFLIKGKTFSLVLEISEMEDDEQIYYSTEVSVTNEEFILYFTKLFYHDPAVILKLNQQKYLSYEDIINLG